MQSAVLLRLSQARLLEALLGALGPQAYDRRGWEGFFEFDTVSFGE